MPTITKKYTVQQMNDLKQKLNQYLVSKQIQHVDFQIKLSDCVITAYHSGSVVFQGEMAEFYAEGTQPQVSTTAFPQGGSDEVGTGDYFGPVVVCACVVDEEIAPKIQELGVQDSKQMTDERILQVAPQLKEWIPYSCLICENSKYNQIHASNNMNAIKAKLHNHAYRKLTQKGVVLPQLTVVDQFAPEGLYYRYLQGEAVIVRHLHFETKAESKYLAVACASVLARYAFLQTLAKMGEVYQTTFPKGAGAQVDHFAQAFVDQHGFEELNKVAKLHFKNTDKIKKN